MPNKCGIARSSTQWFSSWPLCRGLSEFRCKWPDTPGVSLAGRVHDDRNHWAVTAAADTNDDVSMASSPTPEELATARELVRAAQARGVSFADTADGVLKALTKTVVETALEEELSDHLGYDKHDPAGRNGGNSRNGTRTKTVLTDTVGEIEIQVPRDRAGSFDPQIVRKHQRRLTRVDEIVLSLYAKGLTTGEIAAHFDELYEAKISPDTISRITDKIIADMADWVSRPLESIYAAIFIDALSVKVRDGQVANRPFYAAIGVDLAGHKDVLGWWAGDGAGESAKFWFAVLTDLRNRGIADVFFLVCDGLKGLPDVVGEVWPATIVRACTVHLIRNSFRYLPRQHWDALRRDLKPIYTAPTAAAAEAALDHLNDRWGSQYPALIRMWRSCWNEFIPFLDGDGFSIASAACRSAWFVSHACAEPAQLRQQGTTTSAVAFPGYVGRLVETFAGTA
jgi:putative transposase